MSPLFSYSPYTPRTIEPLVVRDIIERNNLAIVAMLEVMCVQYVSAVHGICIIFLLYTVFRSYLFTAYSRFT